MSRLTTDGTTFSSFDFVDQVIEEDYFDMWAMGDDDTPGKTSAMFQVHIMDTGEWKSVMLNYRSSGEFCNVARVFSIRDCGTFDYP